MEELYNKLKNIKFPDNRSKLQRFKDYLKATLAIIVAIPIFFIIFLFLIYLFAIINNNKSLRDMFEGLDLVFDSIIVVVFIFLGISFLLILIWVSIDWSIKEFRYIKKLKLKDRSSRNFKDPHL